jgi:hypothetical protein
VNFNSFNKVCIREEITVYLCCFSVISGPGELTAIFVVDVSNSVKIDRILELFFFSHHFEKREHKVIALSFVSWLAIVWF